METYQLVYVVDFDILVGFGVSHNQVFLAGLFQHLWAGLGNTAEDGRQIGCVLSGLSKAEVHDLYHIHSGDLPNPSSAQNSTKARLKSTLSTDSDDRRYAQLSGMHSSAYMLKAIV